MYVRMQTVSYFREIPDGWCWRFRSLAIQCRLRPGHRCLGRVALRGAVAQWSRCMRPAIRSTERSADFPFCVPNSAFGISHAGGFVTHNFPDFGLSAISTIPNSLFFKGLRIQSVKHYENTVYV